MKLSDLIKKYATEKSDYNLQKGIYLLHSNNKIGLFLEHSGRIRLIGTNAPKTPNLIDNIILDFSGDNYFDFNIGEVWGHEEILPVMEEMQLFIDKLILKDKLDNELENNKIIKKVKI